MNKKILIAFCVSLCGTTLFSEPPSLNFRLNNEQRNLPIVSDNLLISFHHTIFHNENYGQRASTISEAYDLLHNDVSKASLVADDTINSSQNRNFDEQELLVRQAYMRKGVEALFWLGEWYLNLHELEKLEESDLLAAYQEIRDTAYFIQKAMKEHQLNHPQSISFYNIINEHNNRLTEASIQIKKRHLHSMKAAMFFNQLMYKFKK